MRLYHPLCGAFSIHRLNYGAVVRALPGSLRRFGRERANARVPRPWPSASPVPACIRLYSAPVPARARQ